MILKTHIINTVMSVFFVLVGELIVRDFTAMKSAFNRENGRRIQKLIVIIVLLRSPAKLIISLTLIRISHHYAIINHSSPAGMAYRSIKDPKRTKKPAKKCPLVT